ncbi:MAG: tRNA 4-thiouridine(8) synthase ThiI [Patescibacteria group bacterium]
MRSHRPRILLLFSGGLDSILAAKLLEEQGVQIVALFFKSYFFSSQTTKKMSASLKLKFREEDISKSQLNVVKNPRYGYGSALNPCIDCHLLMLKKAAQIMRKEKFDGVATGEVLGERPMSQNRQALDLIEKEAGLKGLLIRPLSARLLEASELEKSGLINRAKLEGISGRSRARQFALAEKYGVKNFPTPAGGCLLTNKEYGEKLKLLLDFKKNIIRQEINLLKAGRVFKFKNNILVIGRNAADNKLLHKNFTQSMVLIESKDVPGPTTIILGRHSRKDLPEILSKIVSYIKKEKMRNAEALKFIYLKNHTQKIINHILG